MNEENFDNLETEKEKRPRTNKLSENNNYFPESCGDLSDNRDKMSYNGTIKNVLKNIKKPIDEKYQHSILQEIN